MCFGLRKIGSHQINGSKGFLYFGIIQTVIGMVFLDDAGSFLQFGDSSFGFLLFCQEHCIIGNLRYAVIYMKQVKLVKQ